MFDQIFGAKKHATVAEELNYRPDLDGLRAIAVWSVVFYHLSRNALPGGYLGVDIFFVLSGYLITSILWRDALANKFSIVKFYDRRIRRIMPALVTILTFSTVVGTAILLPSDLTGYGKSLLSSLGFVANIYFWRDTDYFSPAADTKPLLHLWSLGVEEQFYILFPWLIAVLARFRKSATLPSIVVLVVLSLLLDVYLRQKGGAAPAFFLLPTRMWELGIGGVLAVLPTGTMIQNNCARVLSIVGTILVATGIIFPAVVPAVVPVAVFATVGTGLIIFAGSGGFTPEMNRILSTPPFVFFGLISYSLYLWHWPVIVFSQYYLVRPLSVIEGAEAVVFMAAAAYISWRYIERPFRDKSTPILKIRIGAVVGVAALAVTASALLVFDGLPWRLNGEAAIINAAVGSNYRCVVSDFMAFGASRACALNLPSRTPEDADVVLMGNSHAQMYAPVVRDLLAKRGLHGLLVPLNGCLPTVTANVDLGCNAAAQKNLTEVSKLSHTRIVILGLTWWQDALVQSDGKTIPNADNRALIATIDDLVHKLQAAGKRVVLIGPIAEPRWNIASDYSRDLAFNHPERRPLYMPAKSFQTRFATVIVHFETNKSITFLRPDHVQCRGSRCEFLLDGHSLFSDETHISRLELARYRTVFDPAFSHP